MLTLYQFEISPFCDKIRRVLNVKRVPYRTREVGLLEAQMGYRKVNPVGKVPAIIDGDGTTLGDSTDIAYYIEERHPTPPLVPRDPRERALMHVLEDWADESLYFFEVRLRFGIAHNRARTLPKLLQQESGVIRVLAPMLAPFAIGQQLKGQGIGRRSDTQVLGDLGRHLDALAALLAGRDYLVGTALTLADIAVFAQLFAIRDSTEGGAAVLERRDVNAFMERVEQATRPHDAARAA
jgi:glutathione S-transferase